MSDSPELYVVKPRAFTSLKFKIRDKVHYVKHRMARMFFDLSMRLYGEKDSAYIRFAKKQFELLGYKDVDDDGETDGPNQWIQENVFDVLKLIGSQGHSGSSIPYMTQFVSNFMMFTSVVPCEDKEEQWVKIDNDLYQHSLCGSLFKSKNISYTLDGYIFREPSGCCYTSGKSKKVVQLPFNPSTFKSIYVDVVPGATEDSYDIIVDKELRKEIEENDAIIMQL